jgi:hypothetical protein
LGTFEFLLASSFSKRALHRLLGTPAAMTLHVLTLDLTGSTLIGAIQWYLETFSVMISHEVRIVSTISSDCFVGVLQTTIFTLVRPKDTITSKMLPKIFTLHRRQFSCKKFATFVGAVHSNVTTPTVRLEMFFQCPQLSSPLATPSMVTAAYL